MVTGCIYKITISEMQVFLKFHKINHIAIFLWGQLNLVNAV
jgi:hypothetical protein